MKLVAVTVGLAVALVIGLWIGLSGSREAGRLAADQGAHQVDGNQASFAEPRTSRDSSMALDMGSSTVDGRASAAGAESIEEQALPPAAVAPPTPTVSSVDFASRFEGKSLSELKGEMARLKEDLLARQKEIIGERMAANQFTKFYVQPGQQVNLAELGLPEWQKARGPKPTAGRVRRSSKNDYVEIVTVPPGEYPDFDSMQEELRWLYERTDALAAGGK